MLSVACTWRCRWRGMPEVDERMPRRLLVVSCEYDATQSPQGMRWVMLSRALAELGWQVDVIAFDDGAQAGPSQPACVSVVRVFPGPYRGVLAWWQGRRSARAAPAVPAPAPAAPAPTAPAVNWKGRVDAWLRNRSASWLYPDLRREGLPFLRRALREALAVRRPDAVVLSHEPPLPLLLARDCAAAGVPFVADLGDPVLAPYTPRRWQRVARALEADTCESAARVVVTSDATRALLQLRHCIEDDRIAVVSQGFVPSHGSGVPPDRGGPLRVAYTGRFYRFRDPRPMFDALPHTDGVVLSLAIPDLPEWFDAGLLESPAVDWRGRLPHERAIALQAQADVLLLLGNDEAAQVPGKLFEYFGLPRPILYVVADPDDEGARLVERLRRGLVVRRDAIAIAEALARLAQWKREGVLAQRFDLSPDAVAAYSWPALARRYVQLIESVIPTTPKPRSIA